MARTEGRARCADAALTWRGAARGAGSVAGFVTRAAGDESYVRVHESPRVHLASQRPLCATALSCGRTQRLNAGDCTVDQSNEAGAHILCRDIHCFAHFFARPVLSLCDLSPSHTLTAASHVSDDSQSCELTALSRPTSARSLTLPGSRAPRQHGLNTRGARHRSGQCYDNYPAAAAVLTAV